MDIKVGVRGIITDGTTPITRKESPIGWYIMVEKAAGGYLILYSRNFDERGSEGYDNWVLEGHLDQYFNEAGYKIRWLDG